MKNGLRQDQREKVEELKKIYKSNPDDKRAFLQMPTGTGKTYTILTFCIEQLKVLSKATVAFVCHQDALSSQNAEEFGATFKKLGGVISEDDSVGRIGNIKFEFMTWQSLTIIAKKTKTKKHIYDMIAYDECHFGSSEVA